MQMLKKEKGITNGEIENIKIGKLNVNSYAFVCFKEPDQASKAKINL